MELESSAWIDSPCGSCKRTTGVVRCDECLAGPLTCQECFVNHHKSMPFHWAHVWNRRYFEKCSFADLGGILCLGHGGLPCDNAYPNPTPSDITIAHTNGVHRARVLFCECFRAAEHWKQLIQHRIFPATLTKPKMAFTIKLLKLCHSLSLGSKAVMYDVSTILRRLTDDAFHMDVPVSCFCVCVVIAIDYITQDVCDSLTRTLRLWRKYMFAQRSGQAHHLNSFIPGRDEADGTTLCPACPLPGINLEVDEIPSHDDPRRYDTNNILTHALTNCFQVCLCSNEIYRW